MRDITKLHPLLQEKATQLVSECVKNGLIIAIGECVRTVVEQDALYSKGKTKPGIKVTNAKGSTYSSMHQWGIAFDFYRNDGKGAYNDTDGFFTKVGKIGKSIGLEWGGSWISIKDKPHFQLPNWGSTPTKLKKQYGTPDKFMKTWVVAKPQTTDYSLVFDAKYYSDKYADLKKEFTYNETQLLSHFINNGMKEKRQASPNFNIEVYMKYPDLVKAFGNDYRQYYLHYIKYGHDEGRKAV